MPRRCTICDHPDREALDRELSAGGAIGTIAAIYGVSPDALKRHRANHLLPEARKRLAKDDKLKDVDVLEPGSFYCNPEGNVHGPAVAREETVVLEIYDGPHYPEKPDFYTDERDAR